MSGEECKSLAMISAGESMDCRWRCCTCSSFRTSSLAQVAEADGPWSAARRVEAAVEADDDYPYGDE